MYNDKEQLKKAIKSAIESDRPYYRVFEYIDDKYEKDRITLEEKAELLSLLDAREIAKKAVESITEEPEV